MHFVFTVSIIPSVAVLPSSGGNGRFSCFSVTVDSIMSIQWLMNGSATLTNEAIASGNAVVLFDDVVETGILDVINFPLEFNETSIQCHGVLTSGTNFTTEPALLLLQGKITDFAFLSCDCHNFLKGGVDAVHFDHNNIIRVCPNCVHAKALDQLAHY